MSDFAMDALVVTGEADVFKDVSGSDGYLFIQSGCLLYTSDAADDTPCVDLGGRRIIKKKKQPTTP